jgi:triosephosphate isomerase
VPRKFLIAGNWKMNASPAGFDGKDSPYRTQTAVDVIVFPTFVDLHRCVEAKLIVGAQYGRPEASGAFTGDVSMAMLAKNGCRYVLCGHSERRKNHGESNEFVLEQAIAALEAKLHPIVCVGETAEEREKGKEKDVVAKQIKGLPAGVTIAYEPVWAIGTGKTPTAKEAQEMHAWIRKHLSKEDQDSTRILYGGSMNAANAEEFLKQKDIDGGLLGGASLKLDEFRKIVEIADSIQK